MGKTKETVQINAECNKGVLGSIKGSIPKEIDQSTINIASIKVKRCESFFGKGTCDCPLKNLSNGELPPSKEYN